MSKKPIISKSRINELKLKTNIIFEPLKLKLDSCCESLLDSLEV